MANLGMGYGASADLGLGSMLADQVQGETDEERKKRLAQMAAQRAGTPQSPMGAVADLFGGGPKAGGMGY